MSHLRLKSELTNNKNFLVEKSFIKTDLLLLCKAYKVKVSAKKKKDQINSELVKIILQNDCIPAPSELKTVETMTSGSSHSVESSVADGSNLQEAITSTETGISASHSSVTSEIPVPSTSFDTEIPGSSTSNITEIPVPSTSFDTEIPGTSTAGDTEIQGSSDTVLQSTVVSGLYSSPSKLPPTKKSTAVKSRKRKSGGKGKGKGKRSKGKQKTKFSGESDENCAICYKGYVEGEDWIQCDICSLWYHRFCVNLEDGDEWCRLTENVGEQFRCQLCE